MPNPTDPTPPPTGPEPRPADPAPNQDPLSDPYDWGPEGIPEGKPFRYVPGKGYVFEE